MSTAVLDDPFRTLLKKMSPTVTAAVDGVAPPVPPPGGVGVGVGVGAGLVGVLGLVGVELLSLQLASTLVANNPPTRTIIK